MNAKEVAILLRATARQINDNRPAEVMTIAQELKTLVQLRVQTRGEDYSGQQFESYTPGTKRQREKKGFQTNYVDLTQTGRLWGNIRPSITESGSSFTTVSVGAQTELNKIKLGSFVKKRPNPLLPNEQEINLVNEANRRRLQKHLNNLQ